jgi:uroporphyrinogen decarboxylase
VAIIARESNKLLKLCEQAYNRNQRLVAPLAGFPGCDLTGHSIKVAQQNHGVHYACIKSLVDLLRPDAAFMMMDLSVESNALGLPVRFPLDESSTVEEHPVESLEDLKNYKRIRILQDSRVESYIKTVEMMSLGLPDDILVGAYVIGPVSLAGLLCGAEQIAMDSVTDPQKLHAVCDFATNIIQEYACALVHAGADIVCVLEPTGVILGPEQFKEFSSHYVEHIMESYRYAEVDTVYHVCGNTMHLLSEMAEAGVSALSLDSPETGVDLQKAAEVLPEEVVLIGNTNPTKVMLHGTVEDVRTSVTDLLEKMKPYKNFLLSTGCDLPPGTPAENMKAFMEQARGTPAQKAVA